MDIIDSNCANSEQMPSSLKVTKVKGRELYPREKEWLEAYMLCGVAADASRMIGIEKCPAQYGARLRSKLSLYIQANLREMIGRSAPVALEAIYDIALNCTDDKTRLMAAQDLLNRAGYKEAVKIEMSMADKSIEELDKEINSLLRVGGIVDAEVVNVN